MFDRTENEMASRRSMFGRTEDETAARRSMFGQTEDETGAGRSMFGRTEDETASRRSMFGRTEDETAAGRSMFGWTVNETAAARGDVRVDGGDPDPRSPGVETPARIPIHDHRGLKPPATIYRPCGAWSVPEVVAVSESVELVVDGVATMVVFLAADVATDHGHL
ncbi:MAG: hypothetical protein GY719_09925 [bacterium]|nr:hypothetical protein [bacterium]